MTKLFAYFVLLLPFILILPSTVLAELEKEANSPLPSTVTLRLPPSNPTGQYIKQLLTEAYAHIGAEIEWFESSGKRELVTVESGKLTGALARAAIIEESFPTLIRIPQSILSFKLFKVSDRLRCGYCLDKDIHSISYAKGSIISERYIDSLPKGIESFALSATQQLSAMIKKRRVDSVLLMDFQLTDDIKDNPLYIIDQIDEEVDYHYLSPKYAHLEEPLTKAFETLVNSGRLKQLKRQFNLYDTNSNITVYDNTNLKLAANHWSGYTNKDGTGIYWRLVDSIFNLPFTKEKHILGQQEVINSFNQGGMDILIGAYQSLPLENAIFSHYHIDFEYPLLVFANNQLALDKFSNKEADLNICMRSSAGPFLRSKLGFINKTNISYADSSECEQLLLSGKVEALITYQYYLPESFDKLLQQTVIERTPLFLAFQNTEHGLSLKHFFDKKIKKMAQQGELKHVFPNRETYIQAHISRLKSFED